ncbi:MAG: hypothetical protein K2N48_14825 [Muribaculaceae bacterium]|nr:hypothetical protein [Muribaculaceae bacterium]
MKDLTTFVNEALNEANETIKSEKDFRAAAKAKFEEVYGDDLDTDKMKKTIDGLLNDNKDLVDKGEWGELIGMLNKSFASKSANEGLIDAKVIDGVDKSMVKDIDQLPPNQRNTRYFSDVANTFDALGMPIATVTHGPGEVNGRKVDNVSKVTRNHVPAYDALKALLKTKDYASYVEEYPEVASALLSRLFPSRFAGNHMGEVELIDLFTELLG